MFAFLMFFCIFEDLTICIFIAPNLVMRISCGSQDGGTMHYRRSFAIRDFKFLGDSFDSYILGRVGRHGRRHDAAYFQSLYAGPVQWSWTTH